MEDKQKVYIKGSAERGNEVIKFLENLGGYNCYSLDGHNSNNYYFIAPDGTIQGTYPASSIFSFVKEFYKEIDLPRWKPEYEGSYYFINDRGKITPTMWESTNSDDLRYELGNCFRTPQEAETARDKIEELLKHT